MVVGTCIRMNVVLVLPEDHIETNSIVMLLVMSKHCL